MSSSASSGSSGKRPVVRVTHRFKAAAERVFDAFLDPAKAGKFMFATPTGKMVKLAIDARVGGKFEFVDRRDGEDVSHGGEYLVIDRPRRLVFTLSVPKYDPNPTRVEIEIVPHATGCELTLTHEIAPDWEDRKQMVTDGWAEILAAAEASLSNKQSATSFMQLVGAGRVREAYDKFVAPDFIHHNPFFRGDRQSLLTAMEENAARTPEKRLEIKHALEEGDLVAVHSHVRQNPQDRGGAVVHILRFEGGRVIELWDIGQAIPAEMVNERGMF